MGLRAWPLRRYSRCRPSSRTSTAPTSRSTRRCLDTCGWARPSSATRSLTGRSPPARTSRICRRRGSATALKASAVVAARATAAIIFPYGNVSSLDDRDRQPLALVEHGRLGHARQARDLLVGRGQLEQFGGRLDAEQPRGGLVGVDEPLVRVAHRHGLAQHVKDALEAVARVLEL